MTSKQTKDALHTVRNLHFLSKNSTLISRENWRFFWAKNAWKCCGFGLFSYWQLWFHEKNYQNFFLVKNSWKYWGFVKIEFLDKNLTFRIVWLFNAFFLYLWIWSFKQYDLNWIKTISKLWVIKKRLKILKIPISFRIWKTWQMSHEFFVHCWAY